MRYKTDHIISCF